MRVVPALGEPGLCGRAELLCCGCPDGTEMMDVPRAVQAGMAAMPSCPQRAGRTPGPCLHGPPSLHGPPPLWLKERGVCFGFVFYCLIFLSLGIGSRESIPPRLILTL